MGTLAAAKKALMSAGIMDDDAAQAERATWPMDAEFEEPVQEYVTFVHGGQLPPSATAVVGLKGRNRAELRDRVQDAFTTAGVPFIVDGGRLYL